MKATHLLPLLVVVLASSLTASAQTYYRINSNLSGANIFSSFDLALQTAAAAYAMDPTEEAVLICEGANSKYDDPAVTSFAVDFPLIIYGTGYFLDENPNTQADTRSSKLVEIVFNPGSEGSEIYGVEADVIEVDTDNITVGKCFINTQLLIKGDNVTALKNFIVGSNATTLVSVTGATNLVFMNNFMNNTNASGSNFRMDNISAGIILYNNFWESASENQLHNATVSGNYFRTSDFDITTSSSNLVISDNAEDGPSTFLNTAAGGNDLSYGAIPDSVFCFAAYQPGSLTTDGRYSSNVSTTSYDPASDNPIVDIDGTTTLIGMYGGADPYLFSGMPRIPSVYEYAGNPQGTSSGGTTSVVKTKTHK